MTGSREYGSDTYKADSAAAHAAERVSHGCCDSVTREAVYKGTATREQMNCFRANYDSNYVAKLAAKSESKK